MCRLLKAFRICRPNPRARAADWEVPPQNTQSDAPSRSEGVDSAVPLSGGAVHPISIGGNFSEVAGPVTSTMMDGPAVALDSGTAFSGLVELRSVSLIGDLHVKEGEKRQDAYAVHIARDIPRIEIVVCDGVGSRMRSNEGAAVVATTVAREAAMNDADPVGSARSRLIRMASAAGLPPIEYSTTLIWAEVKVGSPGEAWPVRFVQYGDGDVRLLRVSERMWYTVLRSAPADEGNVRSFSLPLADRPSRQCVFSWMPGNVLVVATDGLTSHLDSGTKVGHYLADSWCSIPDRWQFLSDVAFRALGAGDDRTAVALWRIDEGVVTRQQASGTKSGSRWT